MKRTIIAWGILLLFAPIVVKSQSKIAVNLKTTYFKFDLPDNLVDSANGQGIGNALAQTTSGSILYTLNGVEHIIGTPSYTDKDLFPIHFIKKGGIWKLDKLYTDVSIGIPRNYVFIDSSNIAYADHGREYGDPWPYGNIFTVKTQGDTLNWTKISQFKSFYHSVAVGDLNNDKKFDLIGLHMGSYNPWKGNNGLHPYLQQQDGNFQNGVNTIEDRQPSAGGGSVLIADIMGDSQPEVIVGTYGGTPFAFSIYSYDKDKSKYVFNKSPKDAGVFKDRQQGSTSIKLADFDKDGKIDMAIASEGYPGNQIQIWQGQGNGDFIPGQLLNYDTALSDGSKISLNSFREFEIADINEDGWLDIIVHPFASGSKFRINPGPMSTENPRGYFGTGIKLNNNIWINNNGILSILNEDLRVPDIYPGFIKGTYINGKLKYFGFEQAQSNNIKHAVKIHEITVTFCKDLVKPQFNNSKLNFCDGDSLKLSISNVNLGDTIKWHSGNKIEVSNTKFFKESLKIFVTRTDSLGCTISSDTISITKNTIPTLPIVKDTVFCQNILSSTLLATGLSGNTITWYGTNATGGTGTNNAVVASTIDTTTKSYYVSQINNTTSCESPRAKITVKINPAPVSPSVKDTSYCNSINADTLKATPLANHSLSWYGTSATGGTASTFGAKPNTTTSGTFSYYVSQFNNATGCEGPRAKIGVTIIPLPSPPTVKDTSYCNNASIDTLRVIPTTGNSLLWYGTSATGGTATNTAIKPSTTVIGTSSFYLSQIATATGCESLRAKLNVTVNPIPSAPIISRDTINNLVSNVTMRNSWYKDGTLITDTTQKFKPTSAGSYSVKTTQNGCISAMSSPYYYLVTDIVRLNNGEFIKLTPNPFINFVNIDFVVKGHQRLNIEVFSASTGAKVATRIGITAGSRLTFNELNPGIYFIRVATPDMKVSHQFKMVKL